MKRALLLLAFLFPVLVAIVPSHAKEIKIGLITPLSGDVKTYGESVRNSFLIAVEEANAKGGVAGMKITYVIQDDRNDATEAANVANLLVNQHRVKAIVGAVTSKATIPVSDVIQAAKIPTLTPTATNPKVTVADGKRKDYMFRSCFIDPFQGMVMAKFSRETLKKKRAAVLFDASNDYSKGTAEVFRDGFRKLGGTSAAFEAYGKDDVDFSALLTKVKASGADVMFLPDYYNKVGLIAKQAQEKGSEGPAGRTGRVGLPRPGEDRRERDRGRLLLQPLLPGRPAAGGRGVGEEVQGEARAGSRRPRDAGVRRDEPAPRGDPEGGERRPEEDPGRPGLDQGFPRGHREIHARPERGQRQERRDREDRGRPAEVREDGEPIGVKP